MQSGQTLEFHFHFVARKVSGVLDGEGTTSPHIPSALPDFIPQPWWRNYNALCLARDG